jgi:hypothetical protein
MLDPGEIRFSGRLAEQYLEISRRIAYDLRQEIRNKSIENRPLHSIREYPGEASPWHAISARNAASANRVLNGRS